MKFLITTIIMITAIISCDVSPHRQPSEEQPITHDEKTLILGVLAPDGFLHARSFNRWSLLKKTKGNVHVFADDSQTMADIKATKHQVKRAQLSEKMGEVLSKSTATRLIIFVSAHGAPWGNFCYENQHQCHLTEESLLDVLARSAEKPNSNLKHVLVISNSCYSKVIMDRFGAKVKERAWPFEISYLTQTVNDSNGNQSPADSLTENLLIPFDKITDSQIESVFNMTKIDEFVELNNSLIPEGFKNLRMTIHSPSGSSTLNLADFGFDIGIEVALFPSTPRPFPSNKSVQNFLENISLNKKFYSNIEELIFHIDGYPLYRFFVGGDTNKTIDTKEFLNKEYSNLNIFLRKHPLTQEN